MKAYSHLFILCILIGFSAPSLGLEPSEKERRDFIAAEKALKLGRITEYKRLKTSLKDYPLLPYLEYRELRRKLRRLPVKEVRKFLNFYEGSALAARLEAIWLKELIKQKKWKLYLAFHQPNGNVERHCDHLTALIKTNQKKKAFKDVEALWLYGKSRPDSCDPVFKAWKEAGKLTQDLIWQRISLAMSNNKTRLARYLSKGLPAKEKKWVDLWFYTHKYPERVLNDPKLRREHPYRDDILIHAVQRLARRDAEAAMSLWNRIKDKYPLDPFYQHLAERRLALSLIRSEKPEAYALLKRLAPCDHDTRLQVARLKSALLQQDWPQLLTWLNELPEEMQEEEGWRYWRARALGETGETEKANDIYWVLASERSYYGFLAADKMNAPYKLTDKEAPVDEKLYFIFKTHPAVQRAKELLALERIKDARREWRHVTGKLSTTGLIAAAKLAESWGWHDQAIFTLARTGYWDDMKLRFPLEHEEFVEKSASNNRLQDAWVWAIMRQESAFMEDAHSSAGAKGLMQLMPATGRAMSRYKRPDLMDPETNIELGSRYLRKVLGDFDRHRVLATAAYNAGPHRVKRWLPEDMLPADIWIELIPFKETRTYVRRVLTYQVIYEKRLGKSPERLSTHLTPVGKSVIATEESRAAIDAG